MDIHELKILLESLRVDISDIQELLSEHDEHSIGNAISWGYLSTYLSDFKESIQYDLGLMDGIISLIEREALNSERETTTGRLAIPTTGRDY